MDVRSEKTQVATQTKPRACASLPRGSGLPAWRRKLPDSSSLGKTHVNGSTQRRRGGGESARRSQKPSLGPLGSPPGPQTLRKRREGSVPRTRPSRSAGSEPRLPPRTMAVQLPPALRPAPPPPPVPVTPRDGRVGVAGSPLPASGSRHCASGTQRLAGRRQAGKERGRVPLRPSQRPHRTPRPPRGVAPHCAPLRRTPRWPREQSPGHGIGGPGAGGVGMTSVSRALVRGR